MNIYKTTISDETKKNKFNKAVGEFYKGTVILSEAWLGILHPVVKEELLRLLGQEGLDKIYKTAEEASRIAQPGGLPEAARAGAAH